MILTCPQCSTRYHVDPASLGGQERTVRCAGCGHRWKASPPSDAPTVIELTPVPVATPRERPPAAPQAQPWHRSGSLVGWLSTAAVLLLLAGAVVAREQVVAAFPASAPVYQWLRLPVAGDFALKIEAFAPKRMVEGGISMVLIEGAIVNVSKDPQTVPPIKVILLDDADIPLQEGTFEAEAEQLAGGAMTNFSGRLINPVPQARKVRVNFDLGS